MHRLNQKFVTEVRWYKDPFVHLTSVPSSSSPTSLLLPHPLPQHAPWVLKSSFHGDSILKFSRSRTRIIFHPLLLLHGNLGKGSLLRIKGGVRARREEAGLFFITWLDEKFLTPNSPPSPTVISWGSRLLGPHSLLLGWKYGMGESKRRKR